MCICKRDDLSIFTRTEGLDLYLVSSDTSIQGHPPLITHHDWVLTVLSDVSDLLRQHPELLKVDEAVYLGLVAIKEEGEVLLDDGEEGDEGRDRCSLKLAILGHVVERIHKAH